MHRDDLHFPAVEQPSRLSLQFEPPLVGHGTVAHNPEVPIALGAFTPLGARPEQVGQHDLRRRLAVRREEVA